jgi:phosphoserine phosphatase RsbU/P
MAIGNAIGEQDRNVNAVSQATPDRIAIKDLVRMAVASLLWRSDMLANNSFPFMTSLLEQLSSAHELQQELLPQSDKNLPYVCACGKSTPCQEVGGDYFDYFDMDDGRFCFALGDVAGKGIPAALLASVVQGILSAQVSLGVPLPAIISNLNRNLTKRGTGNRFVTFFFGMLDSDGLCHYANAGHNPPLLLGRDGSLKELTESGIVLGLFAEARYDFYTVRLHPDDHLVLFTDGLIEALNPEDEEFGLERLCDLLRANARANTHEILNGLQEAVRSFAGNAPQNDDIAILVLGFRESQVSLAS